MDATTSPETAVTGLTYWDTDSSGVSAKLVWADWVSRETWKHAAGDWKRRIDLISDRLGLSDFDGLADAGMGERVESTESCGGRGGKLTLAGVLAAWELAQERQTAREAKRNPVPAMADIAAACEAEGTPLVGADRFARPTRTCVECGSPVYGDHCTHCMES